MGIRPKHRKNIATVILSLATIQVTAQQVQLQPGTALRVALSHRVRMRVGSSVTGTLTEPVYLVDHVVLPAGTRVHGVIRRTRPDSRKEHVVRLLAGDFTPPRIPELLFDSLILPAGAGLPALIISIEAPAQASTAQVLTLGVQTKKESLWRKLKSTVRKQSDDLRQAIKDPKNRDVRHRNYGEMVEKWAVGQLPYHPQIIWSDARFDADLATSVYIPDRPHPDHPMEDLHGRLPEGVLHARLLSSLDSGKAKRGDLVDAITSQPTFSSDGKTVQVCEGVHLYGKVVEVRAARRFGRNGSLRFTFTKLDLPSGGSQAAPLKIHGQVAAIATAPGDHISVDEEGETKANDGPAKYIEPALLAVLASEASPDDHDKLNGGGVGAGATTTASNGFGLIARVVSLSTRNTSVLQGFAYYALAKSVYFRFLDKGHETVFPHDNEMEVKLSDR